MGLLSSAIGKFRNDPRVVNVPPLLSLLCMLGGILWILLLPLNQYSRQTYISENALLPGQVHTYFGGSEQNVFRAYRHELSTVLMRQATTGDNRTSIALPSKNERATKIQELFRNAGLTKTARQIYSYDSAGKEYAGENVYAILQAPRGDGTEAIVIVAALENIKGQDNLNGVALLISLSRYFKRWSLWSKDIIFLITEDSRAGPQAWIDAYHSMHSPLYVADLPVKSGALQGAVCIDYPFEHRFETLEVSYDGINGQLPNLDLINTAISIASGQMGIGTSIQHVYKHGDSYQERLQTLFKGMTSQALGHATGPHSVFMPYHIDAITLTTVGEGWQDEMALGRTVESICRSLNNLLEHLHQSFFFYLLMQSNRFVSIGTYLPSAMAVAAGYSIVALWLWWKAGLEAAPKKVDKNDDEDKKGENGKQDREDLKNDLPAAGNDAANPSPTRADLLPLPLALTFVIHFILPIIPLYLSTQIRAASFSQSFFVFGIFALVFPIIFASALLEMPNNKPPFPPFPKPTEQQYTLMRSLSLLWTGACLTVLATLNFSLSIFLGVVGMPIAFCGRTKSAGLAGAMYALLAVVSPSGLGVMAVAYLAYTGIDGDAEVEKAIQEALTTLAFGWNVWGSWGALFGVWVVWWPAWIVAGVGVASSWFDDGQERGKGEEAKSALRKWQESERVKAGRALASKQ